MLREAFNPDVEDSGGTDHGDFSEELELVSKKQQRPGTGQGFRLRNGTQQTGGQEVRGWLQKLKEFL